MEWLSIKQDTRFSITVVGCQVPDAVDGEHVFLHWKRASGKKEKTGSSDGLPIRDGTTSESFAPLVFDVTLVKTGSNWDAKYLSLSVKKKVKKKEKLVGKALVNLAKYADDSSTVKSIPILKSKVKTGSMDVRFDVRSLGKEEMKDEDRSEIDARNIEDPTEKDETTETGDTTFMGTEFDLITDSELPPDTDMENEVPVIVSDCIRFLLDHQGVEGIFRISGIRSETIQILKIFDAGYSVDFATISPHSVSSALKQYLRSLPEPLFTFELYDQWIAVAAKIEDSRDKIKELIKQLPPFSYETLCCLCFFLNEVGTHEEKSKMGWDNLAVVFAPTLIMSENPLLDPSDMMRDTFASKNVVLELFKSPEKYFSERIELAGFSEREEVTFEQFEQKIEEEKKRKKKEMRRLASGGQGTTSGTIKRIAGGGGHHYEPQKFHFEFNVLSATRIATTSASSARSSGSASRSSGAVHQEDDQMNVMLKWEKKGDNSKSGSTSAVCPAQSPGQSLYHAQFVKSEMSDATLGGKRGEGLKDQAFVNKMKVTFFRSKKTGYFLKKPMKLSLLWAPTPQQKSQMKHADEGRLVIAESIWDMAEIVEEGSKVVVVDLFSQEEDVNVQVYFHVAFTLLETNRPTKITRSFSISGFKKDDGHSKEALIGENARLKKRIEELEKELDAREEELKRLKGK